MWLPDNTYKKSLSTIVTMIVGVILTLCGVALVTENQKIFGVLLIAFGLALLLASKKVAAVKQNLSREKYLRRPDFIKKIEDSAMQAYYLYEKIPEAKTLRYIHRHNAYAAEKLILLSRQELTKEEVILDLEAYDAKKKRYTR